MANKKYKLTDGNYWATDGIHDFGQNKTQREINAALVQADSELSGAINAITPLDTTPTANSTKGVTSGGTYSGIKAVNDKLTTLNSYKATSGVVNSMPLYGFAKQVNSSLLRGYYFMPWYTDGNYNITISLVTLEGIGSISTGISVFTKGYYVVIVDVERTGTAGECFLSRITCNISY